MKQNFFFKRKQIQINPFYSFLALGLLCILLAALLKSRAFIFGYSTSLYIIFLATKEYKVNKVIKRVCPFLLVFLFIGLTFFYKTDSSSGRILVYKLTCKMVKDHPITGVGLNNFANVYRSYQASYFKAGKYTQKELLLADNTQHAFNDYLQFVAEVGVGGIILILIVAHFIITALQKALNNNNSTLLLLASLQLIAISIAALFMHEMEKLYIQFIFILSSVTIMFYAYYFQRKITIVLCLFTLGFTSLWQYGHYFMNYKKYQGFEEANNLFNAGYTTESIDSYKKLYPILNKDVLYLSNYAKALNATNQNNEAIAILQKAVAIDNSYLFLQQLAQYYSENKMYQSAEECYLKAIYMVPNRFTPRYKLFKIHLESHQINKALECGKAILHLPVKIPSRQVTIIKEDVKRILGNICAIEK